jgi:hypothetical protein
MKNRSTVKITGGTVNAPIAGRDVRDVRSVVYQTAGSEQRHDELATLRTLLIDSSEEIVGHAQTAEQRTELEHELRKMRQELQAEEPDGEAVRFRWRSALKTLSNVATVGTVVGQVTELVNHLFGG